MPFSENLIKLQKEKCVTNYRLSRDLKVHATTVQNWREGRQPLLEHAKRVADYFGKTIEEMME